MSHYLAMETQITDQEALVRALCRSISRATGKVFTRNQIEICDNPRNLYGYQNDLREQTANVILRRQHVGGSSNDIGFVKGPNGTYSAIVSDFDRSNCYGEPWLTKLYTYYNVEKAKMEMDSRGVQYTETKDDKGRIQLRAKFQVKEETARVGVRTGRYTI
jgi:hypothetical protein